MQNIDTFKLINTFHLCSLGTSSLFIKWLIIKRQYFKEPNSISMMKHRVFAALPPRPLSIYETFDCKNLLRHNCFLTTF